MFTILSSCLKNVHTLRHKHTHSPKRLHWSGPHSLLQSLSPKPPESMPEATLAAEIPPQPLQKEKDTTMQGGRLDQDSSKDVSHDLY